MRVIREVGEAPAAVARVAAEIGRLPTSGDNGVTVIVIGEVNGRYPGSGEVGRCHESHQ